MEHVLPTVSSTYFIPKFRMVQTSTLLLISVKESDGGSGRRGEERRGKLLKSLLFKNLFSPA